MVSKIALLILGCCVFFDLGSSFHVEQGIADSIQYIIDGDEMSIQNAPHHVQLVTNYKFPNGVIRPKYICGGSLITNDIVLTAAHCIEDIWRNKHVEIYAGSSKLYDYVEKRSGVSFLIHPYFNVADKFDKDIAMIKLAQPFSSPNIVPISLTMAPAKDFEQVRIQGFGMFDKRYQIPSEILRQLTGTLVNCTHPEIFTRTDICVQTPVGKGTCTGDSGSGLVNSKLELIGIAARVANPCGSYSMDWYTSVYDHLIFIVTGLQRLSPDDELANNIVRQVYDVFSRKFSLIQ